MRLGTLKRHWNRLGRSDPFWAVLTHPDKRHGGWDAEQFFRAGVEEIAEVLRRATRLGMTVPRRRALDFGCGVGRLTQALAREFGRCDGVDIAASMVRAARGHNRHPERCIYHLNAAPDLALFANESFSFVYSTLVLQHMEPRYSKVYIRELVRVLAPDGLLVFQLPSHRAVHEPSRSGVRTPALGRLPASAFNARIASERSSLSVGAGEQMTLTVTVENRSPDTWPALPDGWGRYQINLANHWLHEDGDVLQRDDARCPLPHDLPPGSLAELMFGVTTPAFDGDYWLEFDLVQENIGWFAQHGSEVLRIPCHVTGGIPGPGRAPRRPRPEPDRTERPFRVRHPRVFAVLRATRLRDVYWAWRHAVDEAKRRTVVPLRERVYRHVISLVINWWRARPLGPRMEMYCVPRSEVFEIVAAAGGAVVDVEEELVPGGFQSCRYWIRRRHASSPQ